MPEAYLGRPWVWVWVGAALGAVAAARGGEPEKSQLVRGIDVLVIGPFMVWLALNRRQLLPGSRAALALIGAATVSYNATNYLRKRGVPAGPLAALLAIPGPP